MGFMYQISEISFEYFSYKTNTKILLHLHNKFNNPSVVFCSRYTDIIDRTNYKKYGIYQKTRYNSTEYLSDQLKLKINDIFDLTPKPENVMVGCRMRENDHTSQSQDKCYLLFNVTKYVEGEFICYQFRTNINQSKFRCDRAALSYRYNHELYSVSLHPRFHLSNYIKLISFIPSDLNDSLQGLPYVSRRFCDFMLRYGHEAPETSRIYWIAISGDFYSVSRLQSPYDTHCVKNEEEAEFYCNRKCNIAAYRRHNLFPANEWTTRPLPMKHLNVEVLKNEGLLRDVRERSDKCLMKCNHPLCDDWYSVTNTKTAAFKEEGLCIASICSNRPAVIIQYFPRITLMELVMYASSSLGIWFGVSFFAINPFKGSRKHFLTKLELKRRNKVQRFLCHEKPASPNNLDLVFQDLNRRVRRLENNQLS